MPYFELIQIRPALFPVVPAIFGLSCFGSQPGHQPLRNALAIAPVVAPARHQIISALILLRV